MKYKTRTVAKSYTELLEEVQKFNPYHDSLGRFSTANGSTSFTYAPGKSKAHDLAIAREKERQAKLDAEAKAKAEAEAKAKAEAEAKAKAAKNKLGNTASQKKHKDVHFYHNQESEAVEYIQHGLKVSKSEAETMFQSVVKYSGSSYKSIRKFQQDGPPPDMAKESKALDDFVAKSPKWNGKTLYRGIAVYDKSVLNEILDDCNAGNPITQKGSSSWSSTKSVASHFASGGTWQIVFKSAGKQNGTSIKHLSEFSHEDEVLMNSKAQWKPVKVVQKGNKYEIECVPTL